MGEYIAVSRPPTLPDLLERSATPSPTSLAAPGPSENFEISRAPVQRRSARLAPTCVDSPLPPTGQPIVPTNDTAIHVTQIVRRAYPESGKEAFIVRYAPSSNITQEAIDNRTQQHTLSVATRAQRISQVSGDHPFVVDLHCPTQIILAISLLPGMKVRSSGLRSARTTAHPVPSSQILKNRSVLPPPTPSPKIFFPLVQPPTLGPKLS